MFSAWANAGQHHCNICSVHNIGHGESSFLNTYTPFNQSIIWHASAPFLSRLCAENVRTYITQNVSCMPLLIPPACSSSSTPSLLPILPPSTDLTFLPSANHSSLALQPGRIPGLSFIQLKKLLCMQSYICMRKLQHAVIAGR